MGIQIANKAHAQDAGSRICFICESLTRASDAQRWQHHHWQSLPLRFDWPPARSSVPAPLLLPLDGLWISGRQG